MNNEKYAEAVAEIMGWTIHYDTRMGDVWDIPENMYLLDVDKFNPATDWASAGVWIEWLAAHSDALVTIGTYGYARPTVTIDTDNKACEGQADTVLEALKNASEKFIVNMIRSE